MTLPLIFFCVSVIAAGLGLLWMLNKPTRCEWRGGRWIWK